MARTVSILERPVYGVAEAAGLLGLRPDRTRAWLDGYERAGVHYAPVIRSEPTGADIVTWGEFVELGYLREYRRKGVPLQRLRPVIDELRRELPDSLVRFGRPSVAGVSTERLWELFDAGETVEEIAVGYDLAGEDVRAAIAYEAQLRSLAA